MAYIKLLYFSGSSPNGHGVCACDRDDDDDGDADRGTPAANILL